MTISVQARALSAQVTMPTDREIRIERTLNAPRERVWEALTDPNLVRQWWGRGNQLVIERLEVERAGHWRFVLESRAPLEPQLSKLLCSRWLNVLALSGARPRQSVRVLTSYVGRRQR
jgi:Activator of Hsp90 ATPase homolog 1-like protein